MFFPEKMLRVRITIEPQYSNQVLEAIGRSGLLHIDTREQRLKSESEASRVNSLLSLVQKYMGLLGVEPDKQPILSVSALIEQLEQTENSLVAIGTKVDELSFKLDGSRNILRRHWL